MASMLKNYQNELDSGEKIDTKVTFGKMPKNKILFFADHIRKQCHLTFLFMKDLSKHSL